MNTFTLTQKIAIYAIPVLFAIIIHEIAHGWMALRFGDQTARLAGRLTLNPLPHIDLVGTIILPVICLAAGGFIFGWARPVPVDARNMRHPRWNMLAVAAAGPLANLLMAVFWALIMRFSAGFNEWFGVPLFYMGQAGITINIALGVLNLLPIPPLDGGRILSQLLPPKQSWQLSRLEPYGFLILIILLMTGILSAVMRPIMMFLFYLILPIAGL